MTRKEFFRKGEKQMVKKPNRPPAKAPKEKDVLMAEPVRRLRNLMDQLGSEAELVKTGEMPLDKARVLSTFRRHEIRLIEVTVSAARLSETIRKALLRVS